jgi:aryl-alcohol dehydrogenase-like predicted oxidoreductase
VLSADYLTVGGDLPVKRLGYGAMQLTGSGVWGEYPDRGAAIALRHIGLSNVSVEQLRAARRIVDIVAVTAHYNVSDRTGADLLAGLQRHLVAGNSSSAGVVSYFRKFNSVSVSGPSRRRTPARRCC